MDQQNRLEDFTARYETGSIPWDDELPPPELMALVNELDSGKALDLGCGYGRSTIYLAQHGWDGDGVDFVPRAIAIAQERANEAGLSKNVRFHVGSVTNLDFLDPAYDLVVDIGCMHSLPGPELIPYRDGLLRLLRTGGDYLLFAHLRDETESGEDELRWIKEDSLLALFAVGFELLHVEFGITQVEDKPPWKSAWFRFRRINDQG